ncbi:MAG: serine/threonine-protein kinase [Planctomycetota bacterium]
MPDPQSIAGFDVVRAVGSGAHSVIYCVRDRSEKLFALKVVEKESPSDQRFLDQAVAEHEVSSNFDHPLLRKSYRLLRERKLIRTSTVRVLMEYVEGKPLEQFRTADVTVQADLCRQVGEGLAAMHAKGFVHADMKPNNVMVTDEKQVKIIDFGQSCPIHTRKERVQGTPDYIAPEQVRKESLTAQTDVFNLGATMYWLLTGEHVPTLIPKTKKQAGTLKDNRRIESPASLNPAVAPALSSVVMDCIESNPMDRPRTMREVVDRIRIAQSQLARAKPGTGEGEASAADDLDEDAGASPRRSRTRGPEAEPTQATGRNGGESWDTHFGTWVGGVIGPKPEVR